jgi:predicted amidohydrolase
MRIALAQINVTANIATNAEAIYRAIDFAADQDADILLTPEGSLSGYTHQFDVEAVRQTLQSVRTSAQKKQLGLALGTCFIQADGRCYNQIRFYERDGSYLGFHSKTLTCGSWDHPPRGEIEHYAVAPLRTYDFSGTCIGGLICNDLWANPGCTPMPDPHLSQLLAQQGARVIFHAVNGGRDGSAFSKVAWNYHESNLLMRARAGELWIATVDNCLPEHLPCSFPSGIVGPQGEWLCRAAERGEQLLFCDIPLG